MSVPISPSVWSVLVESPGDFVRYFQSGDLSEREIGRMPSNGLDKVTLPATIYLAQLIRSQGVTNAIRWSVQLEQTRSAAKESLLLDVSRSNFLPYSWELRRRARTRRLESLIGSCSATHSLYWTYVQIDRAKVAITEVKRIIAIAKVRLKQVNKLESWKQSGAKILSIKYELVVDPTQPNLATYTHAHVLIAVPKHVSSIKVKSLSRRAARLTGFKFGSVHDWHRGITGYFLKHPLSLRWSKSEKGNLATLGVAARLTAAQAASIYSATKRLDFLSIARTAPSLSLCPNIERLSSRSARTMLSSVLPPSPTSKHVAEQALRVEVQRRLYERVVKKVRFNPLPDRSTAFRNSYRKVWLSYAELGDTGFPVQQTYLNSLLQPSRARPPDVSASDWKAESRLVRDLLRRIDVIELRI